MMKRGIYKVFLSDEWEEVDDLYGDSDKRSRSMIKNALRRSSTLPFLYPRVHLNPKTKGKIAETEVTTEERRYEEK